MARGIIIFGSAGSGKTSLGKIVAEHLNYPYFDLDDYIWRKDTSIAFTVMYSRNEKVDRLMNDISKYEHFVMAGSMSSFHEPFDPLFDLAVHITADTELRLARVHRRELEIFGDRILEGGDMYVKHQQFLNSCSRYETDGSPSLDSHLKWAESLQCKVIYLDGKEALSINAHRVIEAYLAAVSAC